MPGSSREGTYFSLENEEAQPYPFIDIDWTQDAVLTSLLRQSWCSQYAEYIGANKAADLVEHLHNTGKVYEHDPAGTLVAGDGGRPVGVAAIRKLPEISLVTLYEVIPEYQRRGVGHQLLESLCTVSGPLVAHVSIHRPSLVAVYERHGFHRLGTEHVDHFGHNLPFQVVARS